MYDFYEGIKTFFVDLTLIKMCTFFITSCVISDVFSSTEPPDFFPEKLVKISNALLTTVAKFHYPNEVNQL